MNHTLKLLTLAPAVLQAVSYTHLDVYKRQDGNSSGNIGRAAYEET